MWVNIWKIPGAFASIKVIIHQFFRYGGENLLSILWRLSESMSQSILQDFDPLENGARRDPTCPK